MKLFTLQVETRAIMLIFVTTDNIENIHKNCEDEIVTSIARRTTENDRRISGTTESLIFSCSSSKLLFCCYLFITL
jgi:hypothetical protein